MAQVLAWARQAEALGADALNLMTTGTYPFERLLEIGRLLRKEVSVPLLANTRDINHHLERAGHECKCNDIRRVAGKRTPFTKMHQLVGYLRDLKK